MSSTRNGMPASALANVTWIKSGRSGPTGGNCVEVAFLAEAGVLLAHHDFGREGPAGTMTRLFRSMGPKKGTCRCPLFTPWAISFI